MRAVCLIGLALVMVGCDSTLDQQPTGKVEPEQSSQPASSNESREPQWHRFASNEWYELYELKLSENEFLICMAAHKTDAQLGIGISVEIARMANSRGGKFFRAEEIVPTKAQAALVESLLPDGRVLESYAKVEYFATKPIDDENLVDVAAMAKIPLDDDEPRDD